MKSTLKPIYSTAQIRALEQAAARKCEGPTLMERAGLAAADYARQIMDDSDRDVLVIAGPGNNGGDAFEVAARLKNGFFRVRLVFAGNRNRLPQDAARALEKWEACGGTIEPALPGVRRWGLIVDGLFGIGLQRPVGERYGELVKAINALGAKVLALDVPSGLNADTGAVMGAAVRATHTVTFIALKPGLLTLDGPDHCGMLHVAPIGLDPGPADRPVGLLLDPSVAGEALKPRPKNFHKGLAGNVSIIGGATGMVGAALMAGRAALKSGAGRVYVGLLTDSPPCVDYAQPELMLRAGQGAMEGMTVLAVGPGMGVGLAAKEALLGAMRSEAVLVLDADALNLLGEDAALAAAAEKRTAATILTPHPAEAARLLGCSTEQVQSDRIDCARTIALRFNSLVALKGNGTVIASPEGRWWINPTGNPGMASAGMGDALTGLIAGIIAQGANPLDAVLTAVWAHGAAGDEIARQKGGPLGITATEIIEAARSILNDHLNPAGTAGAG